MSFLVSKQHHYHSNDDAKHFILNNDDYLEIGWDTLQRNFQDLTYST